MAQCQAGFFNFDSISDGNNRGVIMKKILIILLLLIYNIPAYSVILTVNQSGSGDYMDITAAVTNAVSVSDAISITITVVVLTKNALSVSVARPIG